MIVLLESRFFPSALIATGAIGLIGQRRVDYLSQLPNCPIKAIIGFDCPACGGSRCVSAIASGDFLQAIDENFLITAIVTGSIVIAIMWLIKGPGFSANFRWVRLFTFLSVTTGLFWMARMVPWQAGEWLISGTYQQ